MKFDILKAFEHVGVNEGDVFTIGVDTINYRIKDDQFQHRRVGSWTGVHIDFKDLMHNDIVIVEKAPWKPKLHDIYYYEAYGTESGWSFLYLG